MEEAVFRDRALQTDFSTRGFAIFSRACISECLAVVEELFSEVADLYMAATYRSTFQIRSVDHRRRVCQVLGEAFSGFLDDELIDCKLIWAGFAVKHPSGTRSRLDIHQDVSMCDFKTGREPVSFWVPLQNTGQVQGGMSVVPRSVFLPSSPRGYGHAGDWESERMAQLVGSLEPLQIHRGEALAFHQSLLHSSSGNMSSCVRVAVMLITVPREKDLRLFDGFDSEGQVVCDDFYVARDL